MAMVSGLVAAGILAVVIGLERLVNAMFVDGIARYTSARFVVAVVWVGTGSLLLVLHAIAGRPRRRRDDRDSSE